MAGVYHAGIPEEEVWWPQDPGLPVRVSPSTLCIHEDLGESRPEKCHLSVGIQCNKREKERERERETVRERQRERERERERERLHHDVQCFPSLGGLVLRGTLHLADL